MQLKVKDGYWEEKPREKSEKSVPVVVKWADTEKERQARRAQKAQSQASNVPHTDSQHLSMFGALPMSYVPPYNGYAYQVSSNRTIF